MIDAHNHLQDARFQGQQSSLIATMKEAGISACIVNGTSENDWADVADLARRFPDFVIPAFGLHPWHVDSRSDHWVEKLTSFLEEFPTSSLGECGLDRWIKEPDLNAQHDVFRKHLHLAKDFDRPLTIHCLKAWGPLLEELRQIKILPPFLLHSFGGSRETAKECLKLGARFSFSGYFLNARKGKTREVFARLPSDRILVETDAPDMSLPSPRYPLCGLNHPANLGLVARELGKICHLDPEKFTANTRRFFFNSFPEK